jgi:hypothetical protein
MNEVCIIGWGSEHNDGRATERGRGAGQLQCDLA